MIPRPGRTVAWALAGIAPILVAGCATASGDGPSPGMDDVVRVVTLRDYNTRVVVIGTMLLGLAAGVMGTYMLLRKRALIGDALSHATLPGIGVAFMVMVHFGGSGKFLPGLLLGAVVAGLAGVGAIMLIKGLTRIKEDAALGIVLSVSFGLGIALLGIIQRMPTGNQAGLESFIYGKTASMLRADALLIGGVALAVVTVCVALAKEFTLLSFDDEYAAAQGWPRAGLDAVMMTLVTAVTVIGLQAVGLILIIALLVIPPAAARFWTNHLRTMLVAAGAIGAASGFLGAALSALVPRLPAGAIIVVVAAGALLVSALLGTQRGIVLRLVEQAGLRGRMARQHLLRAMYEWLETRDADRAVPVPVAALRDARSWSVRGLRRALRSARRRGHVTPAGPDGWCLTPGGAETAARLVRRHRLWELYLITHADIAPSHVDRDADEIEHVLAPDLVARLEALLAAETAAAAVPASPHVLDAGTGGRSRS